MNRNVGQQDRVLRIIFGLVLIGLAMSGQIGPWGYLGIVPILTGVVGRCPAYRLFSIDTLDRRSQGGN